MKIKWQRYVQLGLCLFLWAGMTQHAQVLAQANPTTNIITVSGEGEVRAAPDEVRLVLAIQTNEKMQVGAKTQNYERFNKVLAVLGKYKISAPDVVTDYLSIAQDYVDPQTQAVGYTVRRQLMVTLRDVSKFESLVADMTETNLSSLQQTEFRCTAAERMLDQARVLAMRSAKEKAVLLAKEANRVVGKTVIIIEGYAQPMGAYPMMQGGLGSASMQAVSGQIVGGGAGYNATLGQVIIRAAVTVTYQLE